jgi:general secretion pathway protein D
MLCIIASHTNSHRFMTSVGHNMACPASQFGNIRESKWEAAFPDERSRVWRGLRGVGEVLHRILQLFAVAAILCSLANCSAADKQKILTGSTLQADPVAPVRSADLSAHFPTATDGQVNNSSQPSQPLLFPGSAIEPAPPRPPPSNVHVASADSDTAVGDGVELNFEGADIQSVAKSVLGDTLGVNFEVDPRVQGNVTLASTAPISRNNVLPAFESALRMSNVAIVREGGLLKIVPIAEATGTGTVDVGVGQPGFGVSVVPVRYTSAASLAKTAENFLSRPGAIKADQARNLLLIQGTTAERQSVLDVVQAFDVEWARNRSVGVFPLKSTSPETMIKELERVFESSEGGEGQGMVQFQPIQRMNAVLMITKNPKYLERASQWVRRLDRSDTSGTTVRVYRLQYSNASQVAKILNEIFVTQRSGSGDTATGQIAPGTSAARSRLDSLGSPSNGNNGSAPSINTTTAQNGGSPGTASAGGAGPIAAAFQNFDYNKDHETQTATTSTDSGARGLFQNVHITADTADNAIVVYSNQEDYGVIERSLHQIDRPKLQVAIDATVAEVTLTDQLQFGVQYFFSNTHGNSVSLNTASSATTNTSATTTTGVDAASVVQAAVQPFLQSVLPGANLILGSQAQPSVILSALSTLTDVRVLSAPSVVVMDDQPALLSVGDEIPISTGSATILTAANNPIVNTIQMQNTGVILKVLPHVFANGTIQMEIEQEVSDVANSSSSQPTLTPTISQRLVHSTIAVTSGQTVLLGGLIKDQDQKTKSGLPVLNDIPVVGDLFGTKSGQKQRTEIIMFIKPQLIRNSMDARGIAEEFRSSMQLMRENTSFVGKDPPR